MPEVLHAAAAARMLENLDIDVVHDHTLAGSLLAIGRPPPAVTVVTAHGPVAGETARYYGLLAPHVGIVAISDAQRALAPDVPWIGTVHNGLPVDEYPFRAEKEDFALFLGRISPDKGVDVAIDAARHAGSCWRRR